MRWIVVALVLGFSYVGVSAQFWELTSGPPAATQCLATNSKGHIFAGTHSSKVYRSLDRGATWVPFDEGIEDGRPNFVTISQISVGGNDVLFAAVNEMGILRSTNDGASWQKLDIGINVRNNTRLSVSTRVASGQTHVFVGYDGGAAQLLMRFSTDGGETFAEVPKSNLPSAMSSIFEVFLSPNSNKMFALVSYNKGLYRTNNRGTSWTRIDSDPASGESNDLYKTMRADDMGHLYLGRNALPGSNRTPNAVVLKSTDDGETWEYLMNGWDLIDKTNNKVSGISFGKNGEVWATTEKNSGPFKSTDRGTTWSVVQDGFPGDGAANDVIVTRNNHVFVAPVGSFIVRHLDPASSVNESNVPRVVRADIAPNPASDRVGIVVEVDVESVVRFELLDIAGRSVIEPTTSLLNPGSPHNVWLRTSDLPNGVYAMRAISGSSVTSRTVVISR